MPKFATFPPGTLFRGQHVLVTGATSGLGLEAAIHFVNLGAAIVYITARVAAKGSVAKETIEQRTGKQGIIRVLELDMDTFAGVIKFMETVKKTVTSLDIAVLNAGVHNFSNEKSPDGWEGDLQVNFLSTTLLTILLTPWMEEHRRAEYAQHVILVSSGGHAELEIDNLAKKKKVLEWSNDLANFKDSHVHYGTSKLYSLYATKELVLLFSKASSTSPQINLVCPGPVKTNLAKEFERKSIFHWLIVKGFLAVKAVSAEDGARALVVTALKTREDNGKFWAPYWTDFEYDQKSKKAFESLAGKELGQKVWEETLTELETRVPEVKRILSR